MSAASNHASTDVLLDYWLHDTDPATTDALDEHLMQCDECGQALDDLIALGDGVRAAFRAGAVSGVTSDAFLQRLVAQGLRVREYRLSHNGSVNCTVAPEDELLVAHLEAPLAGSGAPRRGGAVLAAARSDAPARRHSLRRANRRGALGAEARRGQAFSGAHRAGDPAVGAVR